MRMKPGCYSGLRKPLPKELNLRLIFTLRPDFSEVCPHIGVFGEAGYNWVEGGQHSFNSSVKDFIQANFGLRYAF